MEKAKRGRPKKENNCNDVCRVCQENLKATYGKRSAKSYVNICGLVEFDTSVICRVFMHCLGSFLMQDML